MAAEAKLQSKIIKLLESDGWLVVKTIQLSKNGYPDIFAFRFGITVFIEVKAPNGKRSELQKYRIEQLISQGFKAFFCESLDEFKTKIKQ